jgi:regulator of sigma E protease
MQVLGPILIFGAIVLVHELGHFLAARLSGMRVDEFSIGIGPALWQHKGKQTLFSIRPIPIIHYVRIAGMEIEDADTDTEDGFNCKPAWARFLVLFSGSGMNFVLGYLILVLMAMTTGVGLGVKVAAVAPDSPAAQVGILRGDRIAYINDITNPRASQLQKLVKNGDPVTIIVNRDGSDLPPMRLQGRRVTGEDRVLIGISMEPAKQHFTLISAIPAGGAAFAELTAEMIEGVQQMIAEKQGVKGLAGPLGIIDITSKAGAEVNRSPEGWFLFLYLFALITVNIGLLNMLPIPALDGSRIVFLLVGAIIRKPINRKTEAYIHAVGMALLLVFVLYISVNDVSNLLHHVPSGGN